MQLEQRIQALEDCEQIAEVTAYYCHGFDQHRMDVYTDTFAADGVFQIGRRLRIEAAQLREATLAQWQDMPRTFHLLGNINVQSLQIDDGRAAAWADGVAVVEKADGNIQMFSATYTDQLSRAAGRWQFAERAARVPQRQDLPVPPQDAGLLPKTTLVAEGRRQATPQRSLAERLNRLEDRVGIGQTLSGYCRGFDSRDIDLFLDQFEADGVFSVDAKSWPGHAVIRKIIADRSWPQMRASTHLAGNPIIVFVEPDAANSDLQAVVNSSCLTLITWNTGEVDLLTAVYEDRLSKRTGRWRFVERRAQGLGKYVLRPA